MFLLMTAAAFLAAGCATDEDDGRPDPNYVVTEKDRLTRAELNMLIRQAQTFAEKSPMVKQKLTKQQLEYIRNTRPKVQERCWGYKSGFLEMRWKIAANAELLLKSRGKLLQKKPNWKLEICVTKESAPLPEWLDESKISGNLALPPK